MRVILREDMDNLGAAGEVVTVRDGYGRNYLLPRGLAAKATEKDVAKLEHERRVIAIRAAKTAKELAGQVDKLSQVSVSLARATGEGDKLYGSVTNRDIADQLKRAGVEIDHRMIQLDQAIKALGKYEAPVRLSAGVVATLKFWVVGKDR